MRGDGHDGVQAIETFDVGHRRAEFFPQIEQFAEVGFVWVYGEGVVGLAARC